MRQGESVTVVACEAEPPEGVDFVRIGGVGRRDPRRALAFSSAAAEATGGLRFDVVHTFTRTRHQDLYRAGGGSHADYLRRRHSPLGAAYRRLLPRHRSLLGLEQQVFADPAQRIQCASRLVADALVAEHGVTRERILLLPNAVDAERFEPTRHAGAGRRLRAELAPAAQTLWLFPASGWHRKGLDLALAAVARIDDPTFQLWLAGRDDPAPWRRRVARAGLGARVRFLGPRDDLEVVYAAVDGVILPTRYDPFANVTFEAAAAGRPVLTTRANGAAEWLSPEACRVVDVLEVEALRAALLSLASPELRQRMGERARREVAAHHWPGHVEALRAEYHRLADARSVRAEASPR